MLKPFAAGMLLLLGAAGNAGADDAAPTALQKVEVKGALERLVPYKSPYYEMARKIEELSRGRLVLGVQLNPAHPGARVDDVKLRLESDSEVIPVEVDRSGFFVVPMVERMARRDDARFSVNKRKGSLMASLVVLPAVPRNAWTVGGVRQIASDLHAAIGAMAPWYLKPVAVVKARAHGVSVCAASSGANVKVVNAGATVATLALDSAARDHANRAVFCHTFDGKEPYADSSQVVIPDEARVLLL
jgi:hypothetical protein